MVIDSLIARRQTIEMALSEALRLEIADIDFADPLKANSHKDGFIAEQRERAM